MKNGDRYDATFATGCGIDRWSVAVDGDEVDLAVASRWMGSAPFAARFTCRRVGARGPVGWLRVERFAEVDGDGTAHERALPELAFPPLLEFVEVDAEAPAMPDEGLLVDMRRLGYAAWNDAWHLLLWVHPQFEYPTPTDDEDEELDPDAAAFARALRMFDKARLERVTR